MKIKSANEIEVKDNWLYRLYKKRYYKKTIKKFNKELKQSVKEGDNHILYDGIEPIIVLLKSTKLRGANDGIKQAYDEIEARYETRFTMFGTKYFKIPQNK